MALPSSELSTRSNEAESALEQVESNVTDPITGAAFWAAVALPFLHLPLLLVTGLSSSGTATAFVALVALNVVALLIGHSHYRD